MHALLEPTCTQAGRTVTDREMARRLQAERERNVPRVGEPAPLFDLERSDGGGWISLLDYRGSPVVIVFGSFT